jgi:hypothetical protein
MAFRMLCILACHTFIIFISAPNSQHVEVIPHLNDPLDFSLPFSLIQHRVPFVTNTGLNNIYLLQNPFFASSLQK